jgi:heme exporter protein D
VLLEADCAVWSSVVSAYLDIVCEMENAVKQCKKMLNAEMLNVSVKIIAEKA